MNEFWHHQTLGRTPFGLIVVGALSTLLYALAKINFDGAARIFEPILILTGFWAVYRYGNGIGRSRVFWFLWLAVVLQVATWILAQSSHPEFAEPVPSLDRLAKLFIFILLAWWLAGSTRNTLCFWSVASLGVLLSPWLSGDGFREILQGLQGARIDFDLRNAQHTSLFFGSVLIGLLAFHRRALMAPRFRTALRIGWLLAVALSAIVVFITQTRGAWLALLIALLVASAGATLHFRKRLAQHWKWLLAALAFLALATALLTPLAADIVTNRVGYESEVVEMLLNGEVENLPYSSIGIRIHTWRAGWEFFLQHPVLGWGGNGRTLVIAHTPWLPDSVKREFGHLHNSYLELLVSYGVMGLALYLGLLGWLARRAYRAYRQHDLPADVMLFFYAFLGFWSVINLFESYLFFWTGTFVFNVICAGALTHIWRPCFRRSQEAG